MLMFIFCVEMPEWYFDCSPKLEEYSPMIKMMQKVCIQLSQQI